MSNQNPRYAKVTIIVDDGETVTTMVIPKASNVQMATDLREDRDLSESMSTALLPASSIEISMHLKGEYDATEGCIYTQTKKAKR